MISKTSIFLATATLFLASAALEQRDATILTVEKVYHTIIDQPPFLADRTSTIIWTQSTSIIEPEPTVTPTLPADALTYPYID
ncbi:hypothetical protein BDQ12DRAFT_690292 [Crucibulum laeve]|uniref:Uncharacterized protein n=1 Tax=Crucibulum laeve TaxID=68775 RepID=A0A5C3LMM3_9AGAR|nr:hypothetical protein BDQ12DRAFT_690292 [Crucibulum laeve]